MNLDQAAQAFEACRAEARPMGLDMGYGLLARTPRRTIDPVRTELVDAMGAEMLRTSVRQSLPELVDYAIALFRWDLATLDEMLDLNGLIVLHAGLGLLLCERYYLKRGLDDLQAALDGYTKTAHLVEQVPE